MDFITTSFKFIAFIAIMAVVTFVVTALTKTTALEFLGIFAGGMFICFILTMHKAIVPYILLFGGLGFIGTVIAAGLKII